MRRARLEEARVIVDMTRSMVCEVERYGGRAASDDVAAWDAHVVGVTEQLKQDDFLGLFADAMDSERIGICVARIDVLDGVLARKRVVHISALYVLPAYRRGGVAGGLLRRTLEWGHGQGGDFFDLDVAAENPAISLYRKFGFAETMFNMTRPLQADIPWLINEYPLGVSVFVGF